MQVMNANTEELRLTHALVDELEAENTSLVTGAKEKQEYRDTLGNPDHDLEVEAQT